MLKVFKSVNNIHLGESHVILNEIRIRPSYRLRRRTMTISKRPSKNSTMLWPMQSKLSRPLGQRLPRKFYISIIVVYLIPRYSGPEPKDEAQKAKWKEADDARQNALRGQQNAQGALTSAREAYDKVKLTILNSESREAQNNMFAEISKEDGGFVTTQIDDNAKLIKEYTDAKADLLKQGGTGTGASVVVQELSDNMGIPHALPDPTASQEQTDEDYFTPITVEISSSSDTKSSKQEASSLSFGASASYGAGPWSVNASVNHSQSEAQAEAMSELASASVKISFECMRVDITRPWLRPELFYDEDLVLGPGGPL
jgi:hypothetical protein